MIEMEHKKNNFKTRYIQIALLMVFATIGILLQIFRNELVNVGNGFGWDGQVYGNVVLNYFNEVFKEGVDGYHIQRILPSSIVYAIMYIFKITFITNNVIILFTIYNTILILAACYIWGLIASELKLSTKGVWLGFIGLFINFPVLKLAFYYPVLTDTTALFLGILIIYYYLKNNNVGIFVTMILGSFTWASFFIISMPLFIFKFKRERKLVLEKKYNIYITIVGCLVWLSGALFLIVRFTKGKLGGFAEGRNSIMANSFETYCLPLGVILAVLFLYYVMKNILNYEYIFDMKLLLKSINTKNLIISIVAFTLIRFFIYSYIKILNVTSAFSALGAITTVFNRGIRLPFIFGISQVVYYGPIMIITLIFWKKFCSIINEYGYGLLLYIIAGLILSLNSESRFIINIFPAFVIFTVKAIDELDFNKYYYYLLGIISVLYSKIWLLINANPIPRLDVYDFEGLTQTSWQRYFMNIGPWMSDKMYLIQTPVVVITFILIWWLIRKRYKIKNNNCYQKGGL